MIVVFGASGAVGSALLAELRAAGNPVRGAYHSQPKADAATAAGHAALTVDLSDVDTLPPALEGADSVFLLGAMGPDQTRQELNVVSAAAAAGVGRVVKLSVWRADEELTPIARLHRPVEQALQSSGLAHSLVRPNFFMQNFSRQMAGSIKSDGMFAQPESNAGISFVDAGDIARVAAELLTGNGHDGSVYNVTGPEALTYPEAAEVFSQVLGKPVRFVGLTDAEAKSGMLRRGLPEFYADALIEVGRAYRDGGADTVTSTVHDLTGRAPTTFAEFVRAHRHAFVSSAEQTGQL